MVKELYRQGYSEKYENLQFWDKAGKTYAEMLRLLLEDVKLSHQRALLLIQNAFNLDETSLNQVEVEAFNLEYFHKLANDGVTTTELLSKVYKATKRQSLTFQIFRKIRELNYIDLYSSWKIVFNENFQLRRANLWQASDFVLGIPPEITQNPYNHFFTVSGDVIDRWRTVAFCISPHRDYLTVRFLTFTDDTPFDIWDEENLNALDWSIFAHISLSAEQLSALLDIARQCASQLVEDREPIASPTFEPSTDSDVLILPLEQATDLYIQHNYPENSSPVKTLLHLSNSEPFFIGTYQMPEGTNARDARNNSLGILHLTKSGTEDFCRLIEEKMKSN